MSVASISDHPPIGRTLQRRLERIADLVCTRLGETDRDDVAQAAAEKVLRSRSVMDIPSDDYLRRVVFSVVIDRRRHAARRPGRVPLPEQDGRDAGATEPLDPARLKLGEAIADCLQGLTPTRRVATTLYLQGYSGGEVATLLGWKRRRAEAAVTRGMADLKAELTRRGYDP